MGKNQRKTPKASALPIPQTSRKEPRAHHDPDDANRQTPVWSIRFFDAESQWGKSRISLPDHLWNHLFSKLRNYETMTWGEILKDKDHNHDVEVGRLCKDAQERLRILKQDDIDAVFRLRLTGKQRVWGIRDRQVLRLLWWDPDHEICPSTKKHT